MAHHHQFRRSCVPRVTKRVGRVLSIAVALAVVSQAPAANDGGQPGTLRVERLELRFKEDRGHRALIDQGAELRLQAHVTVSGAGVLRADWEVSGPAPDPTFRPLGLVRQVVPATGEVTLDSEPLPTDVPGRYQVRFRLRTGWQRSAGVGYTVTGDSPE